VRREQLSLAARGPEVHTPGASQALGIGNFPLAPKASEDDSKQLLHQLINGHQRQQERNNRENNGAEQQGHGLLGRKRDSHGLDHLQAATHICQGLNVGASDERFFCGPSAAKPLRIELANATPSQITVFPHAPSLGPLQLSGKKQKWPFDNANEDGNQCHDLHLEIQDAGPGVEDTIGDISRKQRTMGKQERQEGVNGTCEKT
jgi:hypothetical protein